MGYGRLMRQILSDPTYVVEIIKRRTADAIDMANKQDKQDYCVLTKVVVKVCFLLIRVDIFDIPPAIWAIQG